MLFRSNLWVALVSFSIFGLTFLQVASAQSSGILVVDLEQAYETSKLGQSMRDLFNLENQSFNDENTAILNDLKKEEIQLTEDRTSLSPESFAVAAAEFDSKVQKIRETRLEKIRLVEERFKLLKPIFFRRIDPFFDKIMREFKATAILEKNSVVRSDQALDITSLLIERVDKAFIANGFVSNPEFKN